VENQPDPDGSIVDPGGLLKPLTWRMRTLRLIRDLKAEERGVTMIENAQIASLISVVAIAMLTGMGTSVNNLSSIINSAPATA